MPRSSQKSAKERAAEIASAVQKAISVAVPEDKPEQAFANTLLKKAQSLADERAKVTKATSANRDMLKGMLAQGDVLNAEQAAAVEVVYPTPEKKDTPETPDAAKAKDTTPPAAKAPESAKSPS